MKPDPGIERTGRRWQFGSAEFDEDAWRLTVNGETRPIEVKPLLILRELLRHRGRVVTKAELLEAVWPGVHVVDSSVSTAIGKLRRALATNDATPSIIETAPGIGYRLSTSVSLRFTDAHPEDGDRSRAVDEHPPMSKSGPGWRLLARASGVGCVLAAGLFLLQVVGPSSVTRPSNQAVLDALWRMDQPAIDRMLKLGLDPDQPLDRESNTPLNRMMELCEWNPGHDRQKMLLLARRLLDAGALPYRRNIWGDTAYSIAAAPRYCGPSHPVTQLLHAYCFNSPGAAGEKCLARYRTRAGSSSR